MSSFVDSKVSSKVNGNTVTLTRARNWCFTLNNYIEDDIILMKDIDYKYLVMGYEVGDSGTPHIQGYIEFVNQRTLGGLKKINKNIHWEIRRGTAKQASDYCKKTEKFEEFGKISRQGNRTDLDEIASRIKEVSLKTIAEEYPIEYIKYNKGLTALKNVNTEYRDRNIKPNILWLWGKSGVGKTKYAFDNHVDVYIKDGTMWWDNYEQNECILIDDFDGKWPYRDLLRLLDRYPYQGQVKGGYTKINSPNIYITCEHSPEFFWHNNELKQILRRIDKVIEMNKPKSLLPDAEPPAH